MKLSPQISSTCIVKFYLINFSGISWNELLRTSTSEFRSTLNQFQEIGTVLDVTQITGRFYNTVFCDLVLIMLLFQEFNSLFNDSAYPIYSFEYLICGFIHF